MVWHGNLGSPAERGRSFPGPHLLRPLGALPGIRLLALQGPAGLELVPHDGLTGWRVDVASVTIEHPGPGLDLQGAFIDSAAILASCRCLVTTDTAIAHLGGASGVDVELLLGSEPDWRWRMPGERSPWYLTIRLWRQHRQGDWADPIQEVAAKLGS